MASVNRVSPSVKFSAITFFHLAFLALRGLFCQNPAIQTKGADTMAGINVKGVAAGGLLAGLIIDISESILNIPVMGAQMEEAMKARNVPPVGTGAIVVFLIGGFILGLILVW